MEFDSLNIVIYEDNSCDAQTTCQILTEWARKHHLNPVFSVHAEPKEDLQELEQADLLILDMELNTQSGIELGRRIRKAFPDLTILITSAHTAYLEKGYVLRASRYFLKPLQKNMVFLEMDHLLEEPAFAQRKLLEGIGLSRIICIEYIDRKCVMRLVNGTEVSRAITLSFAAEQVNGCGFACCHKGILVNLSHVRSIGKWDVEMKSGIRLPLSRRNRQPFLEAYEAWIL